METQTVDMSAKEKRPRLWFKRSTKTKTFSFLLFISFYLEEDNTHLPVDSLKRCVCVDTIYIGREIRLDRNRDLLLYSVPSGPRPERDDEDEQGEE